MFLSAHWPRHAAWALAPLLLLAAGSAAAQAAGAPPPTSERSVGREQLVELALRGHPAVAASRARAAAVEEREAGEGRLPNPELMFELWQVPLSRPTDFDDAGMLMVGLRQDFPAPGSRAGNQRAARAEVERELGGAKLAEQRVAREVRHAFADLLEASRRAHAHGSHRALAERLVAAARARLAAGGPLTDVSRAEVELERIEAQRVAQAALAGSAQARLNALLGKRSDAPIGTPQDAGAETVTLSHERLVALARERRGELAQLSAEARALAAESDAASSEASLPSFSLGALYFAPVGPMNEHGYGVSASMSLPWLWGNASSRSREKQKASNASLLDAADAERMVESQIAEALGRVRSAEARLRALETRLVPVAQRQLDATLSSYLAGGGRLSEVVEAEQDAVMAELEAIDARAELDHALAELEWASGGNLPRSALAAAKTEVGR